MPDTKITWGPAIPTPNGRPSWLLDTETVVDIKTNYGWRCSDGGAGAPPYQWSWKVIKAIRLPADHAYYLATDKGFTRSEEHTSELQSLMRISYAVFCLKKKTNVSTIHTKIITYNIVNQQDNNTQSST